MKPAPVFVESIGLAAPGMQDWPTAAGILAGATYQPAEMPRFAPSFLPPNERRRATTTGRLAFQAAEEAVRGTDLPPETLAAVFASASGDTEVLDRMCATLATSERAVSPTDFHNSVHNAAAGYWSIATRSRATSTALSSFDSSFAAGLLEAVSTVQSEQVPALLVAYDMRPPPGLHPARPLHAHFSTALLLTPARRAASKHQLTVLGVGDGPSCTLEDPELEALRRGNPAALSLPLLKAFANGKIATVRLPYFDRVLEVEVSSCG
jgi:hypothetical protein